MTESQHDAPDLNAQEASKAAANDAPGIEYLGGVRLHQVLDERFDREGLRTLCFGLDIDYDNLPTEGKANKARELVIYLKQRDRLPDLVPVGEQLRPDIPWADLVEEALQDDRDTGEERNGKKKLPRWAIWLGAAILVVLLATLIGDRWWSRIWFYLVPPTSKSTARPTPAPVHVGIASFTNCPKVSDALPEAISPEKDEATFKPLSKIQDPATARSHAELDLVIWGQCSQSNELTMHLEILTTHSPDEVIELESVTAQTSALDLNHAGGLGRAVINYLHNDYNEAASILDSLQQEARTPSEKAELAFLQANSLLLFEQPDRYEEAMSAYDGVLAHNYAPLQAQTYNNRGVAGVNWALQLGRSNVSHADLPYDVVLEAALHDLTAATTTTDVSILVIAYTNLGAAQYWVAEDYDQALEYCEQAIALAPGQPLGYVCRAAARYWVLEETYCNPLPDTMPAREDLAKAESMEPNLADIFFWRGSLAVLQAECYTVEGDKQKYTQEAMDDFRTFSDLAGKRPVELFIDQLMNGFSSAP